MILPTKHQNIDFNPMVIGADILYELRKDDLTLEQLYQNIRKHKNIDLDSFYDTVTFLWLIQAIKYNKNLISKKVVNVSN